MTAGDDVLLNSLAERHVESYRRVVPNLSIKHWMPRWMNRTLPVTEVSTGIQTSIKDICPSWQNVVKRCRSLASWATQKDKGSVIQSGWSNCDATKCNRFTFYNTEGDGIKDPNVVLKLCEFVRWARFLIRSSLNRRDATYAAQVSLHHFAACHTWCGRLNTVCSSWAKSVLPVQYMYEWSMGNNIMEKSLAVMSSLYSCSESLGIHSRSPKLNQWQAHEVMRLEQHVFDIFVWESDAHFHRCLSARKEPKVNFGERMKTAALKVATWISHTTDLDMHAMLDLAGEVRTAEQLAESRGGRQHISHRMCPSGTRYDFHAGARSNSKATGEAAKFGARRLFEERCHTTWASMYFHILFRPSHAFHLWELPLLTDLCFSPFGWRAQVLSVPVVTWMVHATSYFCREDTSIGTLATSRHSLRHSFPVFQLRYLGVTHAALRCVLAPERFHGAVAQSADGVAQLQFP